MALISQIAEVKHMMGQYKDINAQEASTAVSIELAFLQRQRCDFAFESFYNSTVMNSRSYTQEPDLPRQKKIPKRFSDGTTVQQCTSIKEYFKQQYFEIIDLLIGEIKRRFDQPTFSIFQEIEKLIINSCNGAMFEPSSDFTNMYATDINIENLLAQLPMMPDVVRTANKDNQMGIHKITSVNTVCEIFNTCKFPKNNVF